MGILNVYNIFWQINHYRARTAGVGNIKGFGNGFRNINSPFYQKAVLNNGAGTTHHIRFLELNRSQRQCPLVLFCAPILLVRLCQ